FKQRISKNQQLSNWDTDVLTDKQKLYAATDTWACLNIYNHLNKIKKLNNR
ncbi:MAG: 3'-5' exonuclease domain-containing protein 2, partial [Bacteroidaceae bacterium]|nr:3'-5' exonuclease domain-containing protein 2 [Bacteroidaceae bacterium]